MVVVDDFVAVVVVVLDFVVVVVDTVVVVVDFVVVVAVNVVVVLDFVVVVLDFDVVVAEDVVTVVVVQKPAANDASVPSQGLQVWSWVAVASASKYCPATHSVMGVHCRSLRPAAGRRLSNSPGAHVVKDAHIKLLVAFAWLTTNSWRAHVVHSAHSSTQCGNGLDRNVP